MKVRQRYFWFNEAHDKPLPDDRPIVVDGFAGGGGASLGIERGIGRHVDVAINHDKSAIAMHMANHPETKHYCENIWDVDPDEVCERREVLAAWFSPDCTHFSRARGEKPVSKKIRGLAGVVIRWARKVKPRLIFVENVEEFTTWGPVDEVTNQPIKAKAGSLFRQWIRSLRRCGYAVEYRSLTASDYGTPTSRKRLFIVARCDGEPIVWPEPSHGSPRQIQQDLKRRGRCRRLPWRTAAEIIDWTLPCPSIFLTPAEAKAAGCKRPLADKTLKRIAEGVRRYVIEAQDPFIVRCNHGSDHFRGQGIGGPLATVTGRNGYGVVTPFVSRLFGKSVGADCRQPTGSSTCQNKTAVVMPFVSSSAYTKSTGRGKYIYDSREPLRTLTTSNDKILVAPQLMSYYGERPGQKGRGRTMDHPVPTVTTENRFALVSAFIAKHFGGQVGRPATNPFPTITQRGTQNQVVAATLIKNNHGEKQWFDFREPLRTIVAQGTHHAEVRAFLMRYYSSGGQWSAVGRPLPTITARDRLCLGIVLVDGEPFQIVDIGMRMLTPRELFSAQGFPADYEIAIGLNGRPATKSEQVARCGNSVCPQVVEAIVAANVPVHCRREST